MARSRMKRSHNRASKLSRNPTEIALDVLLDATAAARAHGRDRWEFALDIEHLLAAGVTSTSLRELICAGLIEAAVETTESTSAGRKFRRLSHLALSAKTCFMLTDEGESAAMSNTNGKIGSAVRKGEKADEHQAQSVTPHPRWDRAARQLLLGRDVVKQFRVPSPCQELILQVFEEAGWPPYIDDPLPPHDGEDRGNRLRATIKALNRHQQRELLHFSGNGSGKGVRWTISTAASSHNKRRRAARRR